jgi:hypothetical protein
MNCLQGRLVEWSKRSARRVAGRCYEPGLRLDVTDRAQYAAHLGLPSRH